MSRPTKTSAAGGSSGVEAGPICGLAMKPTVTLFEDESLRLDVGYGVKVTLIGVFGVLGASANKTLPSARVWPALLLYPCSTS